MKNYNDSNKNNDIPLCLLESARWPVACTETLWYLWVFKLGLVSLWLFEVYPDALCWGPTWEKTVNVQLLTLTCQQDVVFFPLHSWFKCVCCHQTSGTIERRIRSHSWRELRLKVKLLFGSPGWRRSGSSNRSMQQLLNCSYCWLLLFALQVIFTQLSGALLQTVPFGVNNVFLILILIQIRGPECVVEIKPDWICLDAKLSMMEVAGKLLDKILCGKHVNVKSKKETLTINN